MARTKQAALTEKKGVAQKAPRKSIKALAGKKIPEAAAAEEAKKKRRWHPGTVALRQIRKMQKSATLVIPRAPFARLVREITHNVSHSAGHNEEDLRIQAGAIEALREASEAFLTTHFELCQLQAIHAKRITVMAPDSRDVSNIGGAMGVTSYMDLVTDMGRFVPRESAERPPRTKAPRKATPKKKVVAKAAAPENDENVDGDAADNDDNGAGDDKPAAAGDEEEQVVTE